MAQAKVKDLYRWARYRARLSGMEFNLDLDDIIIPAFCPILGHPLSFGVSVSNFRSPTLDRVNNEKGYIKGNVWVISNLANLMKSSASKDDLISFANWITKNYG